MQRITWRIASATHGETIEPIEPGSPILVSPVTIHSPRPHNMQHLRHGTPLTSILNLCATTIGAGMLGLPKAFASCGIILGVLVIIVTALATDKTFVWLVMCARESRRRSYESNARVFLGPLGERLLNTALLLLLFGACMAMMVITIDLEPQFLRLLFPGASPLVAAILSSALVLPFTLTKDLSVLRYASAASLVCILILFVTQVYLMVIADTKINPTVSIWRSRGFWSVIASFPLVLSSYVAHFNIFKIDYELKHRYQSDMNNIIHVSICGIATPLYIASGLMGYLLYGESVKSNLVQEWYGSPELMLQVCQVAVILTNLFKFPLLLAPLRDSLTERVPALKHINNVALTASLFVLIILAAVSTKSLGTVLALVGSLSGSAVGLILPAAMYLIRYVSYRRRGHAREMLLRDIEHAAMEMHEAHRNDPMLEGLMPPPPLVSTDNPVASYWTAVPTGILLLGVGEAFLGFIATLHDWGTE